MAYFMSDSDQQILLAVSAIITYVDGTMFILGTVGNLMNMIVFCCLKAYRSLVTSVFLAGTTFAGQYYLTISLGFESISKWIGYDIPSRNPTICKFYLYTRHVSIQIYLTCLCLSSIDRYLMTSRSAWRRELMTLKRARLLIGFWIVVWICAGVPHAIFTFDFALFNLCIPTSDFATPLTYLNLVFGIVLPIAILLVFGLLTWKNLGNIRLNALNSQVTRMILLDVMVVAISNIPFGMFLIYIVTNALDRAFTPTETLLIIMAQLISTIQVFGSFYFYLMISSAFRTNVNNMLRKIICFWKPTRTHQVAPTAPIPNTHPSATNSKIINKMPSVVY